MHPILTGLLAIVLLLSACSQPAALQPTPVPPTATPPPTPTATPDPDNVFNQQLESARAAGYLAASYTSDPGGAPVLIAELDLAPFQASGLLPLSADGQELGRISGEQLSLPRLESIPYPNPATGELSIYSFSNTDGAWNTYTNHGGPTLKVPVALPISLADLVGVFSAPGKDPALVAAKLMPDGSIKITPIVFTEGEDVVFSAESVIIAGQEVFYNQLTSAWEPRLTPTPTETPDVLPQPDPVTLSSESPTNPPVYELGNSYHKEDALAKISPQNKEKSRSALLAAARIYASEILGQTIELNPDNLDSFLKEQKDKLKIVQLWSDPGSGGGELFTAIVYRKDASDYVLWFGNADGTLASRPDAGGQAAYEVKAPNGYRLKFNWGEDGNVYAFAIGGGNKFVEDDAAFWFDPTKVTNARDKENLDSAWTHVELPEVSVKNPNYDKDLTRSKTYDGIHVLDPGLVFSVESPIMLVGYSQEEGLYAVGAYRGKEFRAPLVVIGIHEYDNIKDVEYYYIHNLTRAQLIRIMQILKKDIELGGFMKYYNLIIGSPADAQNCNKYNPPFSSASEFSKACKISLSRPGIKLGVPKDVLISEFKQNPQKTALEAPIICAELSRP